LQRSVASPSEMGWLASKVSRYLSILCLWVWQTGNLYLLMNGWRGGATIGRRTCNQEVAGSIPGRALLRSDCRQVVHTHVPLSPSSIVWHQCKSRGGNGRLWKRCGLASITPGASPALPAQDQ